MYCIDCKYFQVLQKPINDVVTGYAVCDKHKNIHYEYARTRELRELTCYEEQEAKE